MSDLAAEDAAAQGTLAKIDSAAVPDVTDTSYQAQVAAIGDHAQTAFNAILAQYRFLGLLAGIKGPNDTDDDVDKARAAVMEALVEVLKAGPLAEQAEAAWKKTQAARDALQERIYDRMRNRQGDMNELMAAEGLLGVLVQGHPANQSETMLEGLASGAYRQNYVDRLVSVPQDMQDDFYALIRQQEETAAIEDARRGARRAAIANYFKNIWNGIKSYYEENMELIRNGQWLLAVGKITVDVALAAAEEVIVAGIVTAITALTAGIAAGMALVLRCAVRMMLSVVARGSRVVRHVKASYVFKIELRKIEPGVLYSNPIPFNVSVRKKLAYHKEIDVEKDLTPAERHAMGEGGQGSTVPDADTAESGSGGNGQRDGDGPDKGNHPKGPHKDLPCFDVPRGVNREEFARQLQEQQDTINRMTADEMAYAQAVLDQARQTWRESGKKGSFTNLLRGNGAAQADAREAYAKDLKDALGLSKAEIARIMAGVDATHKLDIIAGGDPNSVSIGGSAENRRIGPAWTHTNTPTGTSRASMLGAEANTLRAAGKSDHLMNIGLSACE